MSTEIDKRFFILSLVIVGVVLICVSFILESDPSILNNNNNIEPIDYRIITKDELLVLYKSGNDFIVVDCSQPKDVYRAGHLPKAVWTPNPHLFYDYNIPVIVYGNDENITLSFVEDLSTHGIESYYFESGYEGWIN